jgi:hypothetical protein
MSARDVCETAKGLWHSCCWENSTSKEREWLEWRKSSTNTSHIEIKENYSRPEWENSSTKLTGTCTCIRDIMRTTWSILLASSLAQARLFTCTRKAEVIYVHVAIMWVMWRNGCLVLWDCLWAKYWWLLVVMQSIATCLRMVDFKVHVPRAGLHSLHCTFNSLL